MLLQYSLNLAKQLTNCTWCNGMQWPNLFILDLKIPTHKILYTLQTCLIHIKLRNNVTPACNVMDQYIISQVTCILLSS